MNTKRLVTLTALLMCGAFVLPACSEGGGNEGGTQGGTQEGVRANIKMFTSVNSLEKGALETVAEAYESLQQQQGNKIRIDIQNDTNPDAYTTAMKNKVATGVSDPTIIAVTVVPEYHGTDKLVDLSGYLEEPNPYNPDYPTWKDSLEPDAYRSVRAGSTVTIPGISYSSNYTCMFYNKQAVKAILKDDSAVDPETGDIDTSKITWQWMLNALQTARDYTDEKGNRFFREPLGVSSDETSCSQLSFNLVISLMNTYLDQYFRDFTEAVHSQEGDYSYIRSIDSNWQYDAEDPGIDLISRYSYNHNKVVDNFFNHSDEFGPESPRYKEVMENIYTLMQYGSDEKYGDVFTNFNRTTLTYSLGVRDSAYTDLKLFYMETLGYVRTFREAFSDKGSISGYPSKEKITDMLGWFLLPPMESELEGVADNVRAWGGPLENYGVVSTKSTEKDEIAIDFLRFLYSPKGQARIAQEYQRGNYAPQVMRQLVKGVEVPEDIDCTQIAASAKGDSCSNPYVNFGAGNGLSICKKDGSADYVYTDAAKLLSGYIRGGTQEWTQGAQLLDIFKSGFKSYAEQYGMIYNDPAKVVEATGGLKQSPYSATA